MLRTDRLHQTSPRGSSHRTSLTLCGTGPPSILSSQSPVSFSGDTCLRCSYGFSILGGHYKLRLIVCVLKSLVLFAHNVCVFCSVSSFSSLIAQRMRQGLKSLCWCGCSEVSAPLGTAGTQMPILSPQGTLVVCKGTSHQGPRPHSQAEWWSSLADLRTPRPRLPHPTPPFTALLQSPCPGRNPVGKVLIGRVTATFLPTHGSIPVPQGQGKSRLLPEPLVGELPGPRRRVGSVSDLTTNCKTGIFTRPARPVCLPHK